MQMKKTSSDSLFDYYEIQITAGENPLYYYFQAEKDGQVCFYDRLGTDADPKGSHAFLHYSGLSYAGVGQGRGHVPDLTWTASATVIRSNDVTE